MKTEDQTSSLRVWDYHKEAEAISLSRHSYTMIAQSMLIAAYAAVAGNDSPGLGSDFVRYTVCIFGFVYTFFQSQLMTSINYKLDYLKELLRRDDPVYDGYLRVHPTRIRHINRFWIPASLYVMWMALAYATYLY